MPFNGNIGMHDATWRGSFGGSIYKTNGSHGCINLPRAAAKTIYENIEKGMPVLCYHLGGTESGKSSAAAGGGQSGAAAPAPAPAPTPAPVPVPEETVASGAENGDGTAGPGQEETAVSGEGAAAETSPVQESSVETQETQEEQETERHGLPWEYGPGMTQAETSQAPTQSEEAQPEVPAEPAAVDPGPVEGQPESPAESPAGPEPVGA